MPELLLATTYWAEAAVAIVGIVGICFMVWVFRAYESGYDAEQRRKDEKKDA